MIKLKSNCKIGGSINTRTEHHGDETKIAMDIPCTMLIKRKELNSLLREDAADSLLFKSVNGEHFEPVFGGKFGPIPVLGKFEHCEVTFTVGVDANAISFDDCKISKLRIDPQIGGLTVFTFTVQTLMDEDGKAIFDYAATDQPATVKFGKMKEPAKDEPELPFGEPAEDQSLDDAIQSDLTDEEKADIADTAKPKRIRKSRAKPANGEAAMDSP